LKILAIGPVSLNDTLNGVGIRARHFLSRLRSSHEIHYLHFQSARQLQDDQTSTAIIHEQPTQISTSRRVARWLRLGLPCDFSPAMERRISQIIPEKKFDVILTFDFAFLQYAVGRGLPIVADIIDEPVLSCRRDLAITRGVMQKLRLEKHVLELRLYLKRFCPQACKCIVVGEDDARSLHSIVPRANVEVIPNGVDANYFAPDGTASEPFTILFSGNLGYQPNILALHHFAEHIFPIVRERCPQARWYIVGPNVPSSVLAWNSDRVCVTGFVEDLRPYLARAAVVISPLISGGGIKNKVLEAWAMRKPVVATSLGCSGIAAQDTKNILIATDPADFAHKTVELLLDPVFADAIAEGGYRTALENYSWDRSTTKLETILQVAARACPR
jgi:glycosyltransferase involved in cell wall biosynthesis